MTTCAMLCVTILAIPLTIFFMMAAKELVENINFKIDIPSFVPKAVMVAVLMGMGTLIYNGWHVAEPCDQAKQASIHKIMPVQVCSALSVSP